MSLPVSDNFLAAAAADVNQPVSLVQLVLGNYFSSPAYGSTVAASGSAANYPAVGAIDGDRTEINIGPAAGADNGIGMSSWRSTVAPDTTPQTLTVTMTSTRTVNRIKLYHLSSHGLKTYKLSYWNGSAFVDFAATSNIATGGEVSIVTTGELDTIDFDDISTTIIKLTISATAVAADMANVVEIEAYRLVDITDRVKGIDVNRQRDYKLLNPLATAVSINCINNDRFFSFSHIPDFDESNEGFINQELKPNIGIIISLGFNYNIGDPELVSLFVGSVDRISVTPKTRDAVIEARDGIKFLIQNIDSSNLKSAQDISANVQYVLNRANISNYEMSLNTTGINLPYFFSDSQSQLSTIQDLVQAAGDALFYFDEDGIATFKSFENSAAQQHTYSSQADWQAGTLTAIDAVSVPDEILYLYSTPQAWNNSVAGWTSAVSGTVSFANDATGIYFSVSGAGVGQGYAQRASTNIVGDWTTQIQDEGTGSQHPTFAIGIMGQGISGTFNPPGFSFLFTSGYVLLGLAAGPNIDFEFYRTDGSAVGTFLTGFSTPFSNSTPHTVTVRRGSNGYFEFYFDGVLVGSITDGTYASTAIFGYAYLSDPVSTVSRLTFLKGTLSVPTTTNGFGVWLSPALDTGGATNSFGLIESNLVLNGGQVGIYTSSSPDNVTYSPLVQISGNGQINSPIARYLKTEIVIVLSPVNVTPAVLDITINWTSGSGSPKYPIPPSSFTFSFDSTLLDVSQEITDNIGGDSAIINDVTVQAQPLALTGTDADTVWQGTTGTPPTNISVSTPLAVTNGDVLVYAPVISGGMDITHMSGASPAAAVVTFAGGGAGSWVFSTINPTHPILTITITGTGNITDLRIVGMIFSNITYLLAQTEKDATSIAVYGDRQLTISNQWINNTIFADSIAATLVENFKDPLSYIATCVVRPAFSAQIGDRVTIDDTNLDLSADYIIVGLEHRFSISSGSGDVSTNLTLIKIPEGF